jgi:hypothetical protein
MFDITPSQSLMGVVSRRGGVSANDQILSLAHAQAVAPHVRSLGLKGAYVVKGGGVASGPGAKARKARVTISFVR